MACFKERVSKNQILGREYLAKIFLKYNDLDSFFAGTFINHLLWSREYDKPDQEKARIDVRMRAHGPKKPTS
jgi:hypothetical protein